MYLFAKTSSMLYLDRLPDVLLLGFLGFAVAMLITPVYTTLAYHFRWWKQMRTTATTGEKATVFAKLHAAKHKRHIPTMAGMIMVVSIAVVTLGVNLSRRQTWLPLAALVGAGLVGLIDDIINVRGLGAGVAGLRTRLKFGLMMVVALLGGWYFFAKLDVTQIHITYGGDLTLGWLIIPLFVAVVVSTANAVNISDGLDGLAGGLAASTFATYGAIAYLQEQYGLAGFCFTIVGALLAYVWFNIFPARFMMGDVGSFALGTALGVVAMLTNTVVILPIIGFVFVVEAGSSALQILSKRIFERKIFLSAPIHHHFEAIGWPETKVTMRFWVIGQVAGAIGLTLALLGGHI